MGVAVDELNLARRLTECCGYGGLMSNANPAVARKVIRERASESPRDYLAYCIMCRDRLAGVGKRAVHLLDLIWPPGGGSDPATRENPGYSLRHENRARLKEHLLATLWHETAGAAPGADDIVLDISPAVRERLEERRILDEDLRRVILTAGAPGAPRFENPATGRILAAYRPRKVTFWVEYTPKEPEEAGHPKEAVIHNAYSHRMEIGRPAPGAMEAGSRAKEGERR